MMTMYYSDVKERLSSLMKIEMDKTVVTFIDETSSMGLVCALPEDLQKICAILDSHPGEFVIRGGIDRWHPDIVCKPGSDCYIHLKMAL